MSLPRLVILAPAPVKKSGGKARLDKKFVEGMALHCRHWPGPVTCILRETDQPIPFGTQYSLHDLPFSLRIIGQRQAIKPDDLAGTDLIYASADDATTLNLVPLARAVGARIVYALEYTLQTRLQILALDKQRSLLRRLRSLLWHLQQERARRHALRRADAVQFNAYPAANRYGGLNANRLLYLDGRLTADLLATAGDMAARREYLPANKPLRLIHSGRLERMKGSHDLLPLMRNLRGLGVDATLDIYGTGSEAGAIAAGLGEFGGKVRLHDPVDFQTELTRINRQAADIFLACQRQSDPSCSYIEAMGGGLAVTGYDNHMWRAMARESGAGPAVRIGATRDLAVAIRDLDRNREALIALCDNALAFASNYLFEDELARRMTHLHDVLAGPSGTEP